MLFFRISFDCGGYVLLVLLIGACCSDLKGKISFTKRIS